MSLTDDQALRCDAAGSPGFTLLEVLVALIISGFVLLGLSQGLRFGVLASSAGARISRGVDDLTTADEMIRRVVEGMDPGSVTAPAPMTGRQDRFECITALPRVKEAGTSGDIHAELMIVDGRLVLRWRPWLHAKEVGGRPPVRETELLRGVAGISVYYWRPGGLWIDRWNDPGLPSLVRVRIRFPEGDTRRWPDIVAAPGLDRR